MQDQIANEVDRGFITKCAEYGLNYENPQDKQVIHAMMDYGLKMVQNGIVNVDV